MREILLVGQRHLNFLIEIANVGKFHVDPLAPSQSHEPKYGTFIHIKQDMHSFNACDGGKGFGVDLARLN